MKKTQWSAIFTISRNGNILLISSNKKNPLDLQDVRQKILTNKYFKFGSFYEATTIFFTDSYENGEHHTIFRKIKRHLPNSGRE